MDLSLLRTFLAAYRSGSLTAAARQSGLSQPTVTAQIRSLEKQLDQQLFRRMARGVVATAVADELAAQVAPHVDALTLIAERGLAQGAPYTKPVHLGGPAELTSARVIPALSDLIARGLRLRVTLGLAEDLLTGLRDGRFDLVVSTVRPRRKGLTVTTLADEEFVLVAAPRWAAALDQERLAREGAAALDDIPLVSYAEDLPIIRRYWKTVFGARTTRSPAVVVPDLRAVLNAVASGAGVSVLPQYLCTEELAAGVVVPLHAPEVPPINTFYLACRSGTEDTPHLATTRTHLLQQARTW
ncbi:DNA-binding transcriptional regulator, LysR family [Streptomyces sp. WMMB 714]|uniref:LysR family transcriptional regulator n=1 Tax=Streptomyces sp. WMMB 714 TaxID=1286822 RepID=UPI0005F85655|nr:LysR family transcriptional regulator [Streptomyces sp. WMMB 714]SCK09552.1 DNA-binding transcriptional regulator, LysR family [Streptomyces sp. WMMB 714]